MATVEETQAELKGQFEQFSHRQQRLETEVDNTRSELTQAIRDLSNKMDSSFSSLRQLLVTLIVAACADIGLVVTLFGK